MPELASEVRVEEEEPKIPQISAVARTILNILAPFEMGPTDGTTRTVTSKPEAERIFGGWTTNSKDGMAAVAGFFDEGGSEANIGRVVHTTVQGDPTTKTSAKGTLNLMTPAGGAVAGSVLSSLAAPYDLEPGDTLVIDRDALGQATATFNATAASRTAGATGPYVLSNGMTLTIAIDGGGVQTVTFLTSEFANIGAATAAEVAAVINAKLLGAKCDVNANAPRITSDRRGTGSIVNVTGGSANAVLSFVTGAQAGGGNVSNIDAVTSAEVKSVVEAAVSGVTVTNEAGRQRITSNTTGASSLVQVVASSTADDEIGFDNAAHPGNNAGAQATIRVDGRWDGAYAAEVTVQVTAATSGDADHFNLNVLRNGVVVQRFPNVNMDPASPRYVVTMVNDETTGSALVVLTDLDATIASPGNLPAAGTFGPLAGGNDGLSGLSDTDWVGGVTANGRTGLRMFDTVEADILICPGRATSAVQNAMITYSELTREGELFAVLDPPANQTAAQMVTYVKSTAALYQVSEFAAIYWPRVKILNPAKAVYGNDETIVVPPSGIVSGVYARVDQRKIGGAFDHPAGEDPPYRPRTIQGFETNEVLDKAAREKVFPALINPISREGGPIFIDGARCLKDNGNWPTVGQRRGLIFVEKRLKRGLVFLRHRNMRASFYRRGVRAVTVFMNQIVAADALASTIPKKAYFFDFGSALNSASTRRARRAVARLGISTTEPGEFIILRVGPDNRELEAELAAAANL